MKDVVKAIKDHFDSDTDLASMAPIYYARHPTTGSYPYTFFNVYAGTRDIAFSGKHVNRYIVTFKTYEESLDSLMAVHEAIKDRFDRATFAIAGKTLLRCERNTESVRPLQNPSRPSNELYISEMYYAIDVDESF